MMAGATASEWALVAFLLALVLLATKVSSIGETIGGLFAAGSPAGGEPREENTEDRDDRDPG